VTESLWKGVRLLIYRPRNSRMIEVIANDRMGRKG
jgi:hypothetical protein